MPMESEAEWHEMTAKRAYDIWERAGRPGDRAWEHWLQAEAELVWERRSAEQPDVANAEQQSSQSAEHDKRRRWTRLEGGNDRADESAGTSVAVHGGHHDAPRPGEERDTMADDEALAALGDAPPATNLDRALPPAERARARADRHDGQGRTAPAPKSQPPPEHFIVLADYTSLKFFVEEKAAGQRTPSLRTLQTQLFPQGHESYSARDTSQQGRFGAPGQGSGIDERLPMQQEQERRLVALIAAALTSFLRQHPGATWDFAAGPGLHHAVIDRLDRSFRQNLRKVLPKDLSGQPLSSLRVHFAGAAAAKSP